MPGAGAGQVALEDAAVLLLGAPDDEHGQGRVVWPVDAVTPVLQHHLLPGGQ